MHALRAFGLLPLRAVTWRRWVYLVVGGAVLTPYVFLAAYAIASVRDDGVGVVGVVIAATVLAVLAAVATTGSLPAVRAVEIVTTRELLGGGIRSVELPERPGREERWRGGVFFVTHLIAGGVVGTLTITCVPLALSWLLYPVIGAIGTDVVEPAYAMPLYGLGLLIGFGYLCATLGTVLAWLAPRLLGPSQATRIERMERVASDLAERNRLARDLHDSVGHALSVVTLQAGAARRMWDKDPDFAYEALGAVEQSARTALTDLDHVLGLLREESTDAASATLLRLEELVNRSRHAGATVTTEIVGDVDRVPVGVSREAYLIVQEALTNAHRHAPGLPVHVDIAVEGHRLRVSVRNPMPERSVESRPSGGRGVRGMRERVVALGGTVAIGEEAGDWQIAASVDWEAAR